MSLGMYEAALDALRFSIQTQGESFTIIRDSGSSIAQGIKAAKDQYIRFLPETDVQQGDVLVGNITGQRFHVTDTDVNVIEGRVVSIKVYFQTEAQMQRSSQEHTSIYHIGMIQDSIVNIQSDLENVSQAISSLPQANKEEKEDLLKLTRKMSEMLTSLPAENAEEAKKILQRLETIVSEANKPKPDKEVVEFSIESLKKAAANLAQVLPTILPVALEIVSRVQKMLP